MRTGTLEQEQEQESMDLKHGEQHGQQRTSYIGRNVVREECRA